ncbi:hypothetical protein HID58_042237, partial [Brassica napus]
LSFPNQTESKETKIKHRNKTPFISFILKWQWLKRIGIQGWLKGPLKWSIRCTGTNTTSCRRVIYQYSKESTTKEPVVSPPTEHIQYFGGVHPHMGHANRFETAKGRPISCDEAVQLYGGVLIREYRK